MCSKMNPLTFRNNLPCSSNRLTQGNKATGENGTHHIPNSFCSMVHCYSPIIFSGLLFTVKIKHQFGSFKQNDISRELYDSFTVLMNHRV